MEGVRVAVGEKNNALLGRHSFLGFGTSEPLIRLITMLRARSVWRLVAVLGIYQRNYLYRIGVTICQLECDSLAFR